MRKTALLLALLLASPLAFAKMYKYVDEKGQIQYSDKPPATSSQGGAEISKQGRVVKKVESTEERIAREAEEAAQRGGQRKVEEQKRKDKALLATYTSVKEIELARNRNLEPLNKQVKSLDQQIKDSKDPAEQAKLKDQLSAKQKEVEELKKKYEADMVRFDELKKSEKPN